MHFQIQFVMLIQIFVLSLSRSNVLSTCLKDTTTAILPTGYGKSLIFRLLPWIFPVKSKGEKNIVLLGRVKVNCRFWGRSEVALMKSPGFGSVK